MGKGEYPELSLLLPSDPSLLAPIDQTQPKACPSGRGARTAHSTGISFPGPTSGQRAENEQEGGQMENRLHRRDSS